MSFHETVNLLQTRPGIRTERHERSLMLRQLGSSDGKNSCLQCRSLRFDPWVRKISWRREWQPTLVFLAGESHGQKSLAGYGPWGCKELDRNECLTLSLS